MPGTEHKDGQVMSEKVAYYFYRPVVKQRVCNLGHSHRQTIGTEYYKRMADGREVEDTKDEYHARPR